MNRKYDICLFDLDGTLTDSGEGVINSVIYAFKQLGIEVPIEDELRTFVGPPLGDSFVRHGVPKEKEDEAIALYRKLYIEGGEKFNNKLYEGMDLILGKLKEAGYKIYTATSKPENLAIEVLERFDIAKYFDYIAGASLGHERETKADVIRYLLDMININLAESANKDDHDIAQKIVMIGDTKYDVIGAKEFNIPCIGVLWGYGSEEQMKEAGAINIVNTMDELYSALVIS